MSSGNVIYQKPRERLTNNERVCVDGLTLNGLEVVVRAEDPEAPANIDLELNGELWEMKNVTNVTSSVGNQLARARLKWWKLRIDEPLRVVFTMVGAKDTFEAIIETALIKKRPDEQMMVLSNENVLRRL